MSHFTHKLVWTLGQLDSTPQTGGVSYFWGTPPYLKPYGDLVGTEVQCVAISLRLPHFRSPPSFLPLPIQFTTTSRKLNGIL
jgi:hypothetical protein